MFDRAAHLAECWACTDLVCPEDRCFMETTLDWVEKNLFLGHHQWHDMAILSHQFLNEADDESI